MIVLGYRCSSGTNSRILDDIRHKEARRFLYTFYEHKLNKSIKRRWRNVLSVHKQN